jgi:PKD repeat protein
MGILTILFSQNILAQQTGSCGTDELLQNWINESPNNALKYETYLNQLTAIGQESESAKLSKKAVLTIPVVFHVIHNYGPENISKAQILEQMETLNADFRRQNSDTSKTRSVFRDRAADIEIEFKLAKKDPNGDCTDGITRTVSELTNGADEKVKSLVRWDYKNYLNVWVVNYIGSKDLNGGVMAGYSRFPFQTSESEDGIVIDHRFVGSTGTSNRTNSGRTLTHEIGHWLGLLHPFQGGCGGSNCSTSGDRICDTPPVQDPSYGCPLVKNSCSNDSPDELDNVENYMDYANGSCLNMFTAGQKAVMQYYANNASFRGANTDAATMKSTGVFISNPCSPKADFHIESGRTRLCFGESVTFKDLSWNGETVDRVWTFEGGSPSSSTFSSPTVVYNISGKFKVTLKVTNSLGESEIVKEEFIEVMPKVADWASPFKEDFDGQFSSSLWPRETIETYGWQILKGNSYSGERCMVGVIDNSTPVNQKFNFYSPNFDLSRHKDLSPKLSMRMAYSLRQAGAGERIIIYGSNNCGKTWLALRGLIGSTTMFSKAGNNPGWAPTSQNEWKIIEVNLDQHGFASSTSLMLRFELTSSGGNSVYIDDINVDQFVLSTPFNTLANNQIRVFPNPSNGSFTVQSDGINEAINIEISNPLGEIVRSLVSIKSETEVNLPASGMYLLRIYNESFSTIKKVIVTH